VATTLADGEVPRITLRVPNEAAAALGVGATFFEEHIAPKVKIIREGKGQRCIRLVAVKELERWADECGAKLS
jgi:hypothetical protein